MDRTRRVNAARRRVAAAALALIAAGELIAGGLYASTGDHRDQARARVPRPALEGRAGLGEYGAAAATAATAAPPTTVAPAATAPEPSTTTVSAAPTHGSASAPEANSPAPLPPPPVPSTAPTPVRCQTDLSLAASPNRPYNFLCLQGATPLTWATSAVRVYDQGLSPVQTAAFAAALGQWEADAHFTATLVAAAADADVVFTTAPLASDQPGYTEDGYTTVSYRCAPHCAYDRAAVVLSSTASLTRTNWVSTILHELGHVAGLNHVSQKAEMMYPFLTLSSPVVYAAGDQAGFGVLAAERGA